MLARMIADQRNYFASGGMRSLASRRTALLRLHAALQKYEENLSAALYRDLKKSAVEAYASEIGFVQAEIRFALRHLAAWMRPERRRTSWVNFPGRSRISPEPKGVVLILAPWNFPIQLLLTPLVGALAAGNCAVLKPSELAPATEEALTAMLRETFSHGPCAVVTGGADVAEALLQERWDHIFFTGSGRVGKRIMAAAARYLTPVTLELGGKCPCLVERDADPRIAAERIVWGKFLNAGQTCVAPDHVWVHASLRQSLQAAILQAIDRFYGPDPRCSPDYARIINVAHFERLDRWLRGVRIIRGGERDRNERYIAPTVVADPGLETQLMTEEIFGPILPLLSYDNLDALLERLGLQPKPLAAYLFTRNRQLMERIIRELPAGGICINDTVNQLASHELPFGGVGESGFGAYHGRAGFDTFSHAKSVLIRGIYPRVGVRFPPYRVGLKRIKRIYRHLL